MSDEPYNKREIDLQHEAVLEKIGSVGNALELKINTLAHDMRDSLSRVETEQAEIKREVRYTNGKVRKITVALVLLFGIAIGQSFASTHDIIGALVGLVH